MKDTKKHDIQDILQNQENFNKGFFQKSAYQLLEEVGEILMQIRYPYSAGSKDYLFFKDKSFLNKVFTELKTKSRWALTIIKDYKKITEKIIDEKLILELQQSYNLNQVDWLIIGFENDGKQWSSFITDKDDFKDCVEDEIGTSIVLFEDPGWFNEAITIHAYIPDEDGIVRPEAY